MLKNVSLFNLGFQKASNKKLKQSGFSGLLVISVIKFKV